MIFGASNKHVQQESSAMHHPIRIRTGFTLIELLVVISIIALLIAILMPALRAARESARTMQGLSNLRQQALTVITYTMDNENCFPPGQFNSGQLAPGKNGGSWATLINGYLRNVDPTWNGTNSVTEMFLDPNADIQRGWIHYSAHPKLMPQLGWIISWNNGNRGSWAVPAKRTDQIKRNVVMTMDSGQNNAGNAFPMTENLDDHWSDWGLPGIPHTWLVYNGTTADTPIDHSGDGLEGWIRYRQAGQTAANFSFVDGHAETIKKGEVLQRHVRY